MLCLLSFVVAEIPSNYLFIFDLGQIFALLNSRGLRESDWRSQQLYLANFCTRHRVYTRSTLLGTALACDDGRYIGEFYHFPLIYLMSYNVCSISIFGKFIQGGLLGRRNVILI